MFPQVRMRRLRKTPQLRALVRETRIDAAQLVYPTFIMPGEGIRNEIKSMPGQYQFSIDKLIEDLGLASELGVRSTILFGIPSTKDAVGSEGYAEDGIIQQTLRAVKKALPEMLLITDVCMCEYTDHGHCGVLKGEEVDNDASLELLVREAVSHAQAGADVIAPSDMMDGRVEAIRDGLDEAGFDDIPILSYAAKFASAYYGPFRDAAESPPQFGDRKGYQMDPANGDEALREVQLDIAEGADMVMVKPGTPYLDVLSRVKETFSMPTGVYHVSGEYAMIKAAAANGWVDYDRILMETLLSFRRAGADFILTYGAKDAAKLLKSGFEL
jgi:porphobilinogen synthase